MLLTPEVSHPVMSSLNDEALKNNLDMSVTTPVSHAEIWPYVASALERLLHQDATAVLIVLSSMLEPVSARRVRDNSCENGTGAFDRAMGRAATRHGASSTQPTRARAVELPCFIRAAFTQIVAGYLLLVLVTRASVG